MKTLRLTVESQTLGSETRYKVVDHTQKWWRSHSTNVDYHRFDYSIESNEQYTQAWREDTSDNPETAIAEHGPNPGEYNILPSTAKITLVLIETMNSDKEPPRRYYVDGTRNDFMFDNRPPSGAFFTFVTLDNVIESIAYSAIKAISFEVI